MKEEKLIHFFINFIFVILHLSIFILNEIL